VTLLVVEVDRDVPLIPADLISNRRRREWVNIRGLCDAVLLLLLLLLPSLHPLELVACSSRDTGGTTCAYRFDQLMPTICSQNPHTKIWSRGMLEGDQ
jgi:hypothetical protein